MQCQRILIYFPLCSLLHPNHTECILFNTHLHGLLLRLYDEVVVAEDARPHQVPKLLALLPKLLALIELGLRLQVYLEKRECMA